MSSTPKFDPFDFISSESRDIDDAVSSLHTAVIALRETHERLIRLLEIQRRLALATVGLGLLLCALSTVRLFALFWR